MSYLEIDCQLKNKHQSNREREKEVIFLALRLYNRQQMTIEKEEKEMREISIDLLFFPFPSRYSCWKNMSIRKFNERTILPVMFIIISLLVV